MQAAVVADQLGERQQVGGEQLRELAPLLDDRHDLVQVADAREHALVGRVARLALAAGRQLEALEQHLAELLGAAERELAAGELVRARDELLAVLRDLRGDLAHRGGVDRDARPLHRAQHRHERQLDAVQHVVHLAVDEPLLEARAERDPRRPRRGSRRDPPRTRRP